MNQKNRTRLAVACALIALAFLFWASLYQATAADRRDVQTVSTGHTVGQNFRDVGTIHALGFYQTYDQWYTVTNLALNNTASSTFIVVDLDGYTAYPHGPDNEDGSSVSYWITNDITVTSCLDANTGMWAVAMGIIVENDATDGSVWYFWIDLYFGKGCHRSPKPMLPPGMAIYGELSGNTPTKIVTGYKESNNNAWDNDDLKYTFLGQEKYPAPGDMVIQFIEIADGAALSVALTTNYRME